MAKVSGRPEATGRRAASWVGLVLAALLCGIAALLAAGLAYQAIATEVDERRYPPPGERVDVGGYRMHLNVAGQDERGPTVILDAGSQSASFQWGWVQPEVAEGVRLVAYDRPGNGWSEAPPGPLDAGRSPRTWTGRGWRVRT